MPIQLNLQELMVREKISGMQLARKTKMTNANLSQIKNGRSKLIRFSTLAVLCRNLHCQPGDLLQYIDDDISVKNGNIKYNVRGSVKN